MTEDNKVEPTTQGERDKISARLQDVTGAPEKDQDSTVPRFDKWPESQAIEVMAVAAQRYIAEHDNRHGTPVDYYRLCDDEQEVWRNLARKQLAELNKHGRYIEARHIPEPS